MSRNEVIDLSFDDDENILKKRKTEIGTTLGSLVKSYVKENDKLKALLENRIEQNKLLLEENQRLKEDIEYLKQEKQLLIDGEKIKQAEKEFEIFNDIPEERTLEQEIMDGRTVAHQGKDIIRKIAMSNIVEEDKATGKYVDPSKKGYKKYAENVRKKAHKRYINHINGKDKFDYDPVEFQRGYVKNPFTGELWSDTVKPKSFFNNVCI